MPKNLDPFWQYVIKLGGNPGSARKLQCSLCKKVFTRGLHRFKAHISRQTGKCVEIYSTASTYLALQATKDLESIARRRPRKVAVQVELGARMSSSGESISQNQPSANGSVVFRPAGLSPYFGPRTTLGAQPSILNRN